jgi:hypothetical protein
VHFKRISKLSFVALFQHHNMSASSKSPNEIFRKY